jgi:hypothetical protein
VDPSQYVLEALRQDEEFVLYRGEHPNQPGLPPVLLLGPASTRPALETLKKIEHEYSLRDELDSAWAVRPLALSEQRGQTMLVLEDPGGESLDRFLPGPMLWTTTCPSFVSAMRRAAWRSLWRRPAIRLPTSRFRFEANPPRLIQ